MKKIVFIALPIFFIAAGMTAYFWGEFGQKKQQPNFANFKIEDVKEEKLVDFVVEDKNVLEKLPEFKESVVKEKEVSDLDKVALTFNSPDKAEEFANKVLDEYGKEKIEKDVVVNAFASYGDPYYSIQTNLAKMEMSAGWDYSSGSTSTKIAIVDTGVRGTHEDLSGKTLAGYNVITSSAILVGANSDDNGHGTAMASAAAASANNSKGLVGTAYNAQVIPIKVLNSSGSGLASDVASGINWAINNGAKVINLSLGSSEYSQTMHDAIARATSGGAIVVAAAGNDATTLAYPGRDSLVLSVGSVNSSNARSSFSGYGSELDVMAPGESIIVAYYTGNSSYATVTGTSVSTAEVSGIAALGASWHSGANTSEIISYFRSSAQKIGGLGATSCSIYYGCGLANYNRFQSKAGDFKHQFVTETNSPASIYSGQSSRFTLTVRNTGKSTWRRGTINLGTARDHDRISIFTREGGSPTGWLSAQRISLQEATVAPGHTGTFAFWMKNVNVPIGIYKEYFQVVADGIGWMEDYGIYWEVRVGSEMGKYRHSFVTQNSYPTLGNNGSYNFRVTVKNTGSTTWQQGRVNLATSRGQDRISRFTREGNGPSGWITPNRIRFQEASVAPGANATFSFWMKNGNVSPGIYREYFQVVADGVGWMEDYGIYWDVNVPQPTPAYAHAFVSQNGYPTIAHGQAYKFQVNVRNTGTATWTRDRVNLGTSHDKDRIPNFTRESADGGASGWISGNRVRFEQASVAPGQNATFTFYMKNDSTPSGTHRQYFQLVADNGGGWMDDYGIYWDVRVP